MRSGLALAALLLPLSGCYLPPPAYVQPGYPPPGDPPPGYPPPPGYDAYGNIYPGYSYNGGDPTLLVDGGAVPLIFFGGGWGYYDSRHEWHHAPDAVARHLEQQRASGGFRPSGREFAQPGPGGHPPGGAPNGGPGFFHANGAGPPGAPPRPAAAPQPAREEHERRRECPPGQRC